MDIFALFSCVLNTIIWNKALYQLFVFSEASFFGIVIESNDFSVEIYVAKTVYFALYDIRIRYNHRSPQHHIKLHWARREGWED